MLVDDWTDMQTCNNPQGSKLGGAGSPGLPWILLRLPQISAGSPKMNCLLYTTPLWKLMKMQLGSLEKIVISSPDPSKAAFPDLVMESYHDPPPPHTLEKYFLRSTRNGKSTSRVFLCSANSLLCGKMANGQLCFWSQILDYFTT